MRPEVWRRFGSVCGIGWRLSDGWQRTDVGIPSPGIAIGPKDAVLAEHEQLAVGLEYPTLAATKDPVEGITRLGVDHLQGIAAKRYDHAIAGYDGRPRPVAADAGEAVDWLARLGVEPVDLFV